MDNTMMTLGNQIIWLFTLAIPTACIAWTVTHEEVFREPREYCVKRSQDCRTLIARKFFYLFTCEYCFSHYVTIFMLAITTYKLLLNDWRGYLIAGFSLVWIANIYMSLYAFLRIDIKKERIITELEEEKKNPEVPPSLRFGGHGPSSPGFGGKPESSAFAEPSADKQRDTKVHKEKV